MWVKALLIWMGCLVAWFVVLPFVAILGGAALFLYATLAELASRLTGRAPNVIDASAARMTARSICADYAISRN